MQIYLIEVAIWLDQYQTYLIILVTLSDTTWKLEPNSCLPLTPSFSFLHSKFPTVAGRTAHASASTQLAPIAAMAAQAPNTTSANYGTNANEKIAATV